MARGCVGPRASGTSPQLLPADTGSQQAPEDGKWNEQEKERGVGPGTALGSDKV